MSATVERLVSEHLTSANSFVAFLDRNQDAFLQLSARSRQLKDLESTWRASLTFDQLDRDQLEIFEASNIITKGQRNTHIYRNVVDHLRTNLAIVVFDQPDIVDSDTGQVLVDSRLSAENKQRYRGIG